jgi:hypothetical protein
LTDDDTTPVVPVARPASDATDAAVILPCCTLQQAQMMAGLLQRGGWLSYVVGPCPELVALTKVMRAADDEGAIR